MTPNAQDEHERIHSIGVDAIDLARFTDLRTEDGALFVYDEDEPGAWIQSDAWIAASARV
ncbi:hypothetical protein ACNS7O_05865 [Haloferacaceae archaeon DSL9]